MITDLTESFKAQLTNVGIEAYARATAGQLSFKAVGYAIGRRGFEKSNIVVTEDIDPNKNKLIEQEYPSLYGDNFHNLYSELWEFTETVVGVASFGTSGLVFSYNGAAPFESKLNGINLFKLASDFDIKVKQSISSINHVGTFIGLVAASDDNQDRVEIGQTESTQYAEIFVGGVSAVSAPTTDDYFWIERRYGEVNVYTRPNTTSSWNLLISNSFANVPIHIEVIGKATSGTGITQGTIEDLQVIADNVIDVDGYHPIRQGTENIVGLFNTFQTVEPTNNTAIGYTDPDGNLINTTGTTANAYVIYLAEDVSLLLGEIGIIAEITELNKALPLPFNVVGNRFLLAKVHRPMLSKFNGQRAALRPIIA